MSVAPPENFNPAEASGTYCGETPEKQVSEADSEIDSGRDLAQNLPSLGRLISVVKLKDFQGREWASKGKAAAGSYVSRSCIELARFAFRRKKRDSFVLRGGNKTPVPNFVPHWILIEERWLRCSMKLESGLD